MTDVPNCFGRSWELGDAECVECDLEIDCRDQMRRRRFGGGGGGSPRRGPGTRPRRKDENRVGRAVRSMAGDGCGPYSSGVVEPAPRQKGEPWWARIFKNVGLGAGSRAAVETSMFLEQERMRFPEDIDDDDEP